MLFQGTEDHDLVDPVHELRRELASRSLNRRAIDLLVHFGIVRVFAPLPGAKPIPPEINSDISRAPRFDVMITIDLREVDAAIVAQGQGRLVENPEQQLPQAIGRLLDLVEQHSESFMSSVCIRSRFSCVSIGEVSRWPRYPGGEPISFAIS